MEVIPAIDLLNGKCVRLHQGKYNEVTQFNENPLEQALEWQDQGAKRLHLVDLDGARSGIPKNDKSIKEIIKALDIPVQVGGGVRTAERVKELIDYGINNVILGTIAIDSPALVRDLAKEYPFKLIIGIDSKAGKVATNGWLTQSQVLAKDLAIEYTKKQIGGFITTDIATDGTLSGPNLEAIKDIASVSSSPVIASGGIGSMADLLSLLSLEPLGVTGVIVGRALYDGKVNLKEAIQALSNNRLQDITNKINDIA